MFKLGRQRASCPLSHQRCLFTKSKFDCTRQKLRRSTHQSFLVLINFLDLFTLLGSSRPEVFYKKGVLRKFAKFTGKHLCQSLFFNKVAN